MTNAWYRVHIIDEAGSIGSGHRLVFAKEGRLRTTIRCPFTCMSKELATSVWQRMRPVKVPKPKDIAKKVRAFHRSTSRTMTKAVKEMIES